MVKSSKRSSRKRAAISGVIVLVVAILIVAFRLVEEIGHDRRPGDRFVVARVIDGDTVELTGGDRLRLMAIDTPEKEQALHLEAKNLLERLTLGREARIKYGAQRRDRYGRLLGYLYIDTLFINKVIIENGLGYLYLFKDTELNSPEMDLLFAAQRRAITDEVGLFGIHRAPERQYLAGQSSFRFHRPDCRSARNYNSGNARVFASRNEALIEGLAPCRNCQP